MPPKRGRVSEVDADACRLDGLPNAALKQIAASLLPEDGRSFEDLFAFADALQAQPQREAVFSAPQHVCFAGKSGVRQLLGVFKDLRSIQLDGGDSNSGLSLLNYVLGLKTAAPALQRVRMLVVRDMMNMGSRPVQLLQQVAERMPLLNHLELHFFAADASVKTGSINQLTERELAAVFDVIPRLQRLAFCGALMTSMDALQQAIRQHSDGGTAVGLEQLQLRGSQVWWRAKPVERQQLETACASASLGLVQALSASCHRQTLRSLQMHWCHVDSAGLVAIARGLPNLQKLDVRDNRDTELDMESVAFMARKLTQLTDLRMSLVDSNGLPESLAPLTSLVTLSVSNCSIPSKDMLPLLQALPCLRNLWVHITWASVGEQDEHMASWAPALHNLERLGVFNPMMFDTARILAPHLTSLKVMYAMWYHPIRPEQSVEHYLRSALPAGCRVLSSLKYDDIELD